MPRPKTVTPVDVNNTAAIASQRRSALLLTAEAAAFVRISVPHFRRLYRSGEAPPPIVLGPRKFVAQLYSAGPRPVLEALIEVADGRDLDAVLERFARIAPETYRAVGADALPIDTLAVIEACAR
jgi:hypothetical protein